MISLIFIVIAAICNALMDKIENEIQYNTSIFKKFNNPEFWCKTIAGNSLKFLEYTRYRPDAWHISKSLMIIFLISAIPFYNLYFDTFLKPFIEWHYFIAFVLEISLMGTIWTQTFNLFYNNIFKSK